MARQTASFGEEWRGIFRGALESVKNHESWRRLRRVTATEIRLLPLLPEFLQLSPLQSRHGMLPLI